MSLAAMLTMAMASSAAAGFALFHVYSPGVVFWATGDTYAGHAAGWWQWALEQPAAVNPVTDLTGAHCGQGQSGSVWYLAGKFDFMEETSITRSCTIPPGKTLVFPIANAAYLGFPPEAFPGYPGDTVEDVQEFVAGVEDYITDVSLKIDGKNVDLSDFYGESEIFGVTLPEGNVYQELYGLPGGFELTPSGDGGYYVAVAPLLGGKHKIELHAGFADGSEFDVTYNLKVRWF